jgi:hypothetical protein
MPCVGIGLFFDGFNQFLVEEGVSPEHAGLWAALLSAGLIWALAIPIGVCWLVGTLVAGVALAIRTRPVRSVLLGLALGIATNIAQSCVFAVKAL